MRRRAEPTGTPITTEKTVVSQGHRQRPPEEKARRLTRLVLADLFGPPESRLFAVRFWDGSRDRPARSPPAFELVLRHPGALRKALLPPTDANMGGAYVAGHLDIEGDVEAAAQLGEHIVTRARSPSALLKLVARVSRIPAPPKRSVAVRLHLARDAGARHSRGRDAAAIRSHYDVGNDFFRLFLDRRLVYSCAYFPDGGEDLDRAQESKLELICRKLRLRPGERLLDVGCGWGALVLHACARYGVEALGITLSESQAAFAREQIARAGLGSRCRVEVLDYRDLPAGVHFDKVASVGMVEHVGRPKLPEYYREIARVMAPGGLFLNHAIVCLNGSRGIASSLTRRLFGSRTSFIQRFVFPDSELVSPAYLTAPGEDAGLELRDVESLREHYARTLRLWVRRLEARHAEAVRLAGEETYRAWRLYMSASAGLFTMSRIGVIQSLWGKPRADGSLAIPSTRADLYRPAPHDRGSVVVSQARFGSAARPSPERR